jgi:hypothetical protein
MHTKLCTNICCVRKFLYLLNNTGNLGGIIRKRISHILVYYTIGNVTAHVKTDVLKLRCNAKNCFHYNITFVAKAGTKFWNMPLMSRG